MLENRHKGIKVASLAVAVSNSWVSIDESAKMRGGGIDVEKFKKMTGIRGRYIADKRQTSGDFCYAAAEQLLAQQQVDRAEIGVLVMVTQTPDYFGPCTASVLHHRLNLPQDCLIFDVNQGCAGFEYGLNIAASLLGSANTGKALVLCGDTFAKPYSHQAVSYEHASNSAKFLFGDAGAAALLTKTEDAEDFLVVTCADGHGYGTICNPYHAYRHPDKEIEHLMNDVDVFTFATSKAPEMLKEYMSMTGTSPDDYDALVLHQANLFIMKQVAKRAGFPPEKLAVSIDEFANTSSASIPTAIVKIYGQDDTETPKQLLLCGFGVGLTWSACAIRIAPAVVLPLVHTYE